MNQERDLLFKLAPELTDRLGPIVIWEFTASFISNGSWIARMDYMLEGERSNKNMKSILIDGFSFNDKPKIISTRYMNPRIFMESRLVALLREGFIRYIIESPPIDEERTA